MMTQQAWRCRAAVVGAVVATLVAALLAFPAAPASATHQYCGPTATGVHLGGYPEGTMGNGHPAGEDGSYIAVAAVGEAKRTAMEVNRAEAFVALSGTIYDTLSFRAPNKVVKLGFSIAGLALGITATTAEAAVLALEQRKAEVDACNAVLAGDTMDLIFVAQLQEELANLDPADGTVDVPTSMFLLPDDGSPAWTDHAPGYQDRPGHKDLAIPYVDGFADNEYLGVATVVRNTIAHLDAHGIDTGGGYEWVPGVGLQYQDGAKDLWWDAMRLLEDGRVRLAHTKFAEAYRMAVMTETS